MGSHAYPEKIEIDARSPSNANKIFLLLSVELTSTKPVVKTYNNSDVLSYEGRISVLLQLAASKPAVIFRLKNTLNSDFEREYRCTALYPNYVHPYGLILLHRASNVDYIWIDPFFFINI